LNAIIGFSQILRDESDENRREDIVKTYASHINDSGQRLHSMVKDVLQVAKLESGEISVQTDQFRLGVLLEDCVERVASNVDAVGKSIRIAAPEQLLLRADEQLLRLALSHLLSNAVKFTNEGDCIEARASTSDIYGIQIEIFDTGAGVEAEHLSRLGDAFYQADGSLSRSHEGAGLGLYLAKKYVELNSGTLTFESIKGIYFKARIHLPPACLSRQEDVAA
jgi:two-component system cell cycle sensor histidine kinase PleC